AGLHSDVGADGKAGEALLFVVFVDFEVRLLQVVDVVAFFVGDDGVDENEPGFALDDGCAGGRNGWRGLLGVGSCGSRRRRSLRRAGRGGLRRRLCRSGRVLRVQRENRSEQEHGGSDEKNWFVDGVAWRVHVLPQERVQRNSTAKLENQYGIV